MSRYSLTKVSIEENKPQTLIHLSSSESEICVQQLPYCHMPKRRKLSWNFFRTSFSELYSKDVTTILYYMSQVVTLASTFNTLHGPAVWTTGHYISSYVIAFTSVGPTFCIQNIHWLDEGMFLCLFRFLMYVGCCKDVLLIILILIQF